MKRLTSTSRDARLVRRALKVLGNPGYVVTDIVRSAPESPRRYEVVFFEQSWMGLQLYQGSRSVIFSRGKRWVTGKHIPVRSFAPPLPIITAADAVRAVSKLVRPRVKIGPIETVSSSGGFDRQTVLRVDALSSPVKARLVVFGRGRARLAWKVGTETPTGHTLEAVVDAESKKILHQRGLSYHGSASLTIDPGAGGILGMKCAVDQQWLSPGRRIDCLADGSPMPPPVADANGDFGGTAVSFVQSTLDGLVIANTGLDLLIQAGGQTQGRVTMKMIDSGTTNPGEAAMALPSRDKPTLMFSALSPSGRHSASDPGVVLHELAHLVLSHGVGGERVPVPFENKGESGAVMEGLADFLGLTLWNAIRRAPLGTPDIEAFGHWVFQGSARDYSAMIASPSTAPKYRVHDAGSVHKRGMVLCLALWLMRLDIMSTFTLSADAADQEMWRLVCASLPLMPHQDDCPRFCCVSKALRQIVSSRFESALVTALDDRNIPSNCPHTRSQ